MGCVAQLVLGDQLLELLVDGAEALVELERDRGVERGALGGEHVGDLGAAVGRQPVAARPGDDELRGFGLAHDRGRGVGGRPGVAGDGGELGLARQPDGAQHGRGALGHAGDSRFTHSIPSSYQPASRPSWGDDASRYMSRSS